MSADFAHLHVHSHYSLLDGLGKVSDLVAHVKDLGMNSLALTDHGAMYGIIDFYQTATSAGIKPIIGMEAYLAPNGRDKKRGKIDGNPRHLTLLAQNNEGYKNLLKLSTKAFLEGYYYKPRIDYDILQEHSEGVIVLSGCMNSDISKAVLEKRPDDAKRLLEWHIEVFGKERFYVEIQHHPNIPEQGILNEAMITYAKQYGLDLVATNDSHYIKPEDAEAQDVLVCVQTGKKVTDKDRLNMLGEDFSVQTQEQVKEAWKKHPEAVTNTMKIAEMCQVDLEFGVNKLPRFPLPKGKSDDEALRELCEKGLVQRYGPNFAKATLGARFNNKARERYGKDFAEAHEKINPAEARKRLDYELEVIKTTGFSSYFLIVSDFVMEAKRRGILVGPGRGSAAGSFVSYLTNITNVDPLVYDLLFERFLNPERVSMPDIDLDFADDRRQEVIDYVREKYGHEHVSQIITFGTMAARAAVRDAGRALDFPYSFCDTVAKAIPQFTNFEEALSQEGELKQMYASDPQAKKLIDNARKLEGVCRHASTHAAAVVITDSPLTEYVPLALSSTADGEKDTVTQYAMGPVESLGLLKMDFLGLKNLTIIQRAVDLIKERHGVEIDLDNLPEGDAKAYQLLQEGKTIGVFQLESSGMRRYLKELKPTEFEDIISILALYRPGPMDSIPDFIAAKHGKKKITYLHPLLQPILEPTYGVIVTQDQVLMIAREFAGFSYAEADILRKAVGKKIKELLDEQRNKFISGAVENKGIDKKTAEAVWDFIEPFARYGFNRAHAACYAMIAYQTAYLKANYSAEFMAALLTSDEGNTDRQAIEVADALALGIEVLPPDVNESDHDFSVIEQDGAAAIRFGLGGIKNVSSGAVEALILERKTEGAFKDLFDVFRRINNKDFNRKTVESLAKAGAFDSMTERNALIGNVETLLEFNRALHKKQDKGQQNLFGEAAAVELAEPTVELAPVTAASKDERLGWEKELLGLYVSEHPLKDLQKDIEKACLPIADVGASHKGAVRVAGVIAKISKIITKKGQPMVFATIEDMTGSVELLVFPQLYEKTAQMWEDGGKVIVEGKMSDKEGETKVLLDEAWTLSSERLRELASKPMRGMRRSNGRSSQPPVAKKALAVELPMSLGKAQMEELKNVLSQFHRPEGELPVELVVPRAGMPLRVTTQFRVDRNDQLLQALAAVVKSNAARYIS